MSKEHRENIGKGQLGDKHWSKKPEHINKKLFGGKNPWDDPQISENLKKAISISRLTPEVQEKISGPNHWRYKNTIYQFENIISGEIVSKTYNEFRKELKCGGNLSEMMNGKRNHVKGWKLKK